jgi:hypothetical protein
MSGQIQARGNHLMQKRMWIVTPFVLLPGVLLTTALPGVTAPWRGGTVAEIRQDLPGASRESRLYGLACFPCGDTNMGSGVAGTVQLLAQNRQPPAAAPEQAQSSGDEKLDLNDQVIRDVFGPLQRGMEGHNLYQVLTIFDQQETSDYALVRENLRAFFDHYDEIRFRYQLLQATSEKNRGSAVAEIEMEATPADPSQVTLRRETQMRFRMDRHDKGWKLVGFSPADFFAQ